ncbi:hypothetical protein NL495_27890, partial [Klebsiella pneumoniae]|nr:hypothetical protein [Klebsiella pneumoniae]
AVKVKSSKLLSQKASDIHDLPLNGVDITHELISQQVDNRAVTLRDRIIRGFVVAHSNSPDAALQRGLTSSSQEGALIDAFGQAYLGS